MEEQDNWLMIPSTSKEKTGSVQAIAKYIARKGIVTRKELRENFKSGPLRTTIVHLKELGLIYSRKGRNGYVISIPWLIYLKITRAKWKQIVKKAIPTVTEEDLREIEETLRKAKREPLWSFIRGWVKEICSYEKYESQIDRVLDAIPNSCAPPNPEKWRNLNSYYEMCVRPLLHYIGWLLTITRSIAISIYAQPYSGTRELAENFREQEKQVTKLYTSLLWDMSLYSRTLNLLATLFHGFEKQDVKTLKTPKIMAEYEKKLQNLSYYERYNKKTVLKPFITTTIGKLLTMPCNSTS